jgi:DNA-dependent RNA polymerase auxiliary subunit epsilon
MSKSEMELLKVPDESIFKFDKKIESFNIRDLESIISPILTDEEIAYLVTFLNDKNGAMYLHDLQIRDISRISKVVIEIPKIRYNIDFLKKLNDKVLSHIKD